MIEWLRSVMLPVVGSDHAQAVDDAFMFIFVISALFFFLIIGLLGYFAVRYRRRSAEEATPYITHNFTLEVVWTVIPLILVIIIFFVGFNTYVQADVAPADALEIKVTAKKWLWQFEYPNGTRTLNEIHVPAGEPVRLVMKSEDVIHSFYLPTMRIKKDVLPNRYTELWFEAKERGVHKILCTEYCGRGHSDMLAEVTVEGRKEFEEWVETGGLDGSMPLDQLGALLYNSRGCVTCHSLDGTQREGPSYKGVFGQKVAFADGTSQVRDENYLRESILKPNTHIVSGYQPVMPTFQGLLRDREVDALVEFIKKQQ